MSKEHALAQISLHAAFISVLGLLPKFSVPIVGIPITFQTLGIMLAGVMLGPNRGSLSVFLFLFIVALGAPFLAGGRGGIGVFQTPSVGFLLGFPVATFAVGWMMNRLQKKSVFLAALIASIFGGIIILYLPGIIGLAMQTKLSILNAAKACLIFIPGDLVKAFLVAVIAQSVYKGLPSAISSRL